MSGPWHTASHGPVNEDKSTRYHRRRRRAEMLGTAASGAVLIWLLVSGVSLSIREVSSFFGKLPGYEEAITVATFAFALSLLLRVIELPFAYYTGFRLEHAYGLSTQRFGQWLDDQLKATVLGLLLAVLGASIVYATLRWSRDWWWAASAGIFAVAMVGLVQQAPVLLLPLFYRFKPLDRPALVERLLALAARAGTRIVGVYEWRLSSHTKKANAALAGVGRTRRILLSDTLLANYSDDEIEVVLAHELSHHVHYDLWRGMALQTLLLFVGFLAAHLALRELEQPLGLRGIDDPAGLPLLLVVGGICSLLFLPLANALSRRHERRADRFALEMTQNAGPFVSAMKRLSQQNLAEEHPSRVVQWLFYSHPPIRDRIEAARAWERGKSGDGTHDAEPEVA